MASIFQNGISRNTKCAVKDGFCSDSHIWANHYMIIQWVWPTYGHSWIIRIKGAVHPQCSASSGGLPHLYWYILILLSRLFQKPLHCIYMVHIWSCMHTQHKTQLHTCEVRNANYMYIPETGHNLRQYGIAIQ